MGSQALRIDQAVKFLRDYAPGDLAALRLANPSVRLDEDVSLGGIAEDSTTGGKVDDSLLDVELQVASKALQRISNARQQTLSKTSARIRRARLLTLFSTLLGILSTATIISVLQEDYPKLVAYVAAVISLIAIALPPIASFLQGIPSGPGSDIYQLHIDLWKLEDDAGALDPQLQHCILNGCEVSVKQQLVGKANLLLANTREILLKLDP